VLTLLTGAESFHVADAQTNIGCMQKSRVALARVTWTKPHILLLDEPSNHLDIDAVEALIQAGCLQHMRIQWDCSSGSALPTEICVIPP
jgi:ABC-type protease/lipase transport system fused ATPase/permease subunit